MQPNRFSLCFFDVLGFESRFSTLGLDGMLEKYCELTKIVDDRNERVHQVFGKMGFSESAYWTADRDAFVFFRLHGAYASDSLLVWTHTDFPEARLPFAANLTPAEREKRASGPSDGWKYHPMPCDGLLDACNELMCRSLEIGLPLRGALALGDAVLDQERGIYLGQPLIDAARMEHSQRLIGVSFTRSFMSQVVPPRYLVPFDIHLKDANSPLFQGNVLDWPRHWRATRKTDAREIVNELNSAPSAAIYYDNTLRLIDASDDRAGKFESAEEIRVCDTYPQFSQPELALRARAVRRVQTVGDQRE
ncbi:hypothetical protein [Burkholderia sp. 22PA0106]|uniref:hypothetical protein n=1 Tax=Burkholderia sp. 22PA0106 TaxID=3237371 RepID=UPI0039C1C775